MKPFSVKFFEARTSVGLTHEQAADGICATSYISLIESGKRMPSKKLLAAFSERFGVKLELPSIEESSQTTDLQLLEASILIDEGNVSSARKLLMGLRAEMLTGETAAKRNILLARVESRELNYDAALELLEQFLDGGRSKLVDMSLRETAWIEYLRALYESGNLPQAVMRGSELVASELSQFSKFTQVTIYAQLAGCHSELGNSTQSFRFAHAASDIAKALGDPRELARAEWEMAVLASIAEDNESASRWMDQAIAHAKMAEMQESLPRMHIALAAIMVENPDSDMSAIEESMLRLREESEFHQKYVDVSFASVVLAEVAIKREEYAQASEIISRAQRHLGGAQVGAHIELALLKARCEFEANSDLQAWFDVVEQIDVQVGHGVAEVVKHWTDIARVAMARGETALGADAYEHALEAKKRKFAGIE